MFNRLSCLYTRSLSSIITNCNITLRPYSHVIRTKGNSEIESYSYRWLSRRISSNVNRDQNQETKKDKKNLATVQSKKVRFPGYEVLYVFPPVKFASVANSLKRKHLIFTCITIPLIVGLSLLNITHIESIFVTTIFNLTILGSLYWFGYISRNLIGFVYYKSDDGKVILSYVDDKGKRIDFETTVDDIIPFKKTNDIRRFVMYSDVYFTSTNLRLKMCPERAHISDKKYFAQIFGNFT